MKKGESADRLTLLLIVYLVFGFSIFFAPTKDARALTSLGAISICYIARYLAGAVAAIEDNGLMVAISLKAENAEELLAAHRRECEIFSEREVFMTIIVFLLGLWGIGSSWVF